jgi:hypothetical protein
VYFSETEEKKKPTNRKKPLEKTGGDEIQKGFLSRQKNTHRSLEQAHDTKNA